MNLNGGKVLDLAKYDGFSSKTPIYKKVTPFKIDNRFYGLWKVVW